MHLNCVTFFHSYPGMNLEYLTEKERQKELLRLKQERLRAEREGKFTNAAMLIGLSERAEAELKDRYLQT